MRKSIAGRLSFSTSISSFAIPAAIFWMFVCLFVEAHGFFYQPTSGCPKPRRYFFSLIHFFGFLRVPESASLNPVQGIWEKILSSLSFISSIFALSRNLRSLLGLQSGGFSSSNPPRYSQRLVLSIGHLPITCHEHSASSPHRRQVGDTPGSIRLWCLFSRQCPVIICVISPSSFLDLVRRYLEALLLIDGNQIRVCLFSWHQRLHHSEY